MHERVGVVILSSEEQHLDTGIGEGRRNAVDHSHVGGGPPRVARVHHHLYGDATLSGSNQCVNQVWFVDLVDLDLQGGLGPVNPTNKVDEAGFGGDEWTHVGQVGDRPFDTGRGCPKACPSEFPILSRVGVGALTAAIAAKVDEMIQARQGWDDRDACPAPDLDRSVAPDHGIGNGAGRREQAHRSASVIEENGSTEVVGHVDDRAVPQVCQGGGISAQREGGTGLNPHVVHRGLEGVGGRSDPFEDPTVQHGWLGSSVPDFNEFDVGSVHASSGHERGETEVVGSGHGRLDRLGLAGRRPCAKHRVEQVDETPARGGRHAAEIRLG